MFSTTVMTLASGHERRNVNWQKVRAVYEVGHTIKSQAEMDEIKAFFMARMGRAYSFRFKDWADYQTGFQMLGKTDGVKTAFQIVKLYESGGFQYVREITKPIKGTLNNVAIDGVTLKEGTDYTVNWTTGVITFLKMPRDPETQALIPNLDVTIGSCEFDVHARFDIDHMNATHDFWNYQSFPAIPIVEVKELV